MGWFIFPRWGGPAALTPSTGSSVLLPNTKEANELSVVVRSPLASEVSLSPFTLKKEIQLLSFESKAIGGFHSASLSINDNLNNIDDWIRYGLGRHIEIYNPDLTIIWEGFVDRIEATLGSLQFTIGPLLDIGNRVKVAYTEKNVNTQPPTIGTEQETEYTNEVESQRLYGIIQKIIPGNSAKDLVDAEEIRTKFLADPSGPYPATSGNSTLTGSSEPNVKLGCLGYWHWLTTYYPGDETSGTLGRSAKLEAVLGSELNNIFSTDYSRITENTDLIGREDDRKNTAQTILLNINKTGINSKRSTMGFYENRIFDYSPVKNDFEYIQRLSDNRGIVDKNQIVVRPWDIKPGEWILYSDFLIGGSIPNSLDDLQKDLRAAYIESVKFESPYGLSINGVKLDDFNLFLEKLALANGGT